MLPPSPRGHVPEPHSGYLARLVRLRDPVVRRRLLVMADQGASSLSNAWVAIAVAHRFTTSSFGVFSLAMVTYQLVIGFTRALVGEPWLSLYSAESPSRRRGAVNDLLGATITLSCAAALLIALVAQALPATSSGALVALACFLPFLLIQDMWRYVYVIDRPAATLAMDALWLATVVAGPLIAPTDAGIVWYVAMWCLGGLLGAVLGTALDLGMTRQPHPWRWLSEHRDLGMRFLGETTTAQALGHVLVYAVAIVGGPVALGTVRAGQLFFSPFQTLHAGIYLAIVPEGTRLRDRPAELRRKLVSVALGTTALAMGWTLLGMLLPDGWGRTVLGSTWSRAEDLMFPLGLAIMAATASSGAMIGLRSLADARRSLRARLHVTPWLAICPIVGLLAADTWGFAAGTAVGTLVGMVIWWRAFDEALHAVEAREDEPAADVPQVVSGHGG